MQPLLAIAMFNACGAAALALGVVLASRFVKRPAVVHALWIVVLLQLLVPPVFEVGVVPPELFRSDRIEAAIATPIAATPSGGSVDTTALAARGVAGAVDRNSGNALLAALLTLWAAGAVAALLLAGVRMQRFRRLAASARQAPPPLRQTARALADRIGLSRCPPVKVVAARISPLVWPRPGGTELLLPRDLLNRLSRGEIETLIAHELAHVVRRDHWVRWLELVASSLFWWHPAVWWARGALRRAEEQCCDALVVRTLPERARDYADGLLKTVAFLAGHGSGVPVLASGIGEVRNLEERLTMILNRRLPTRLSRVLKFGLAVVALGLLLVFPTWAEKAPPPGDEHDGLQEASERLDVERDEARIRDRARALEREALEVRAALQNLRLRQIELEHEQKQLQGRVEVERIERLAERAETEGHGREAEELGRQAELLARETAREHERLAREDARIVAQHEMERQVELERAVREEAEARREQSDAMREKVLQHELQRSAASEEEIRALRERVRELEQMLRESY